MNDELKASWDAMCAKYGEQNMKAEDLDGFVAELHAWADKHGMVIYPVAIGDMEPTDRENVTTVDFTFAYRPRTPLDAFVMPMPVPPGLQ